MFIIVQIIQQPFGPNICMYLCMCDQQDDGVGGFEVNCGQVANYYNITKPIVILYTVRLLLIWNNYYLDKIR